MPSVGISKRLQGLDDGVQTPVRSHLEQLTFDAAQTLDLLIDDSVALAENASAILLVVPKNPSEKQVRTAVQGLTSAPSKVLGIVTI